MTYTASEWEQLFRMTIGNQFSIGGYDVTRVPGGVLYRYTLYNDQTENYTATNGMYRTVVRPNTQVSVVFCPFPPSLIEKLNSL